MEIGISLKLLTHKVLHRLQVFLVEGLPHQVQHNEALLVRDRAELVRAHHVEHRLDDLLAHGLTKDTLLSDRTPLCNHSEKHFKMLHGADPQHACTAHSLPSLVGEKWLVIAATEAHHRVVAQVCEVGQNGVKCLILAVLEEAGVLLNKLVNNLVEEIERVWLVLRV